MDKSKLTLEKGKLYFFICFSLPCGGKTTFFNKMKEIYEEKHKDNYSLFNSNFDTLRADLAKEYRDAHPKLKYEEAYDKVLKEAIRLFDEQIMNFIKAKESHKVNIILVDRNYPEGLEKFRKAFCKDYVNNVIIMFTPKLTKPIESGQFRVSFSYDYVFQCYLRLKNRHNHEVLNYTTAHSLYTFLSHVKSYQNFNFTSEVALGVHLREIEAFSDETTIVEHIEKVKDFFSTFLFKMKPFDYGRASKCEKEIKDYFQIIDTIYVNVYKETEGELEGTIEDLFLNGI